MVHFVAIAKAVQSLRAKEKQATDKFVSGIDEFVKRDMAKEKLKIEYNLQNHKPLTEFQKWFIQQPEYREV
jgi:hypothetical protein